MRTDQLPTSGLLSEHPQASVLRRPPRFREAGWRRFSLRLLTILVLVGLSPSGSWAAARLAYYSDYLSFIGRDAGGFVAFALDTNRGVDGDAFQAEHFGVLYDQHRGWIEVAGSGSYPNPGVLEAIPDSPGFRFAGTPDGGLTVTSRANDLVLRVEPLPIRLRDDHDRHRQSWGSAPARLSWRGRTIAGRVIYEGLVRDGWNRLTRTYAGTWDNFQGFYLALGSGDPTTWQDLYLRSEGDASQLRTRGFASVGSWSGELASPELVARDKALACGFYRWPQTWEITLAEAGSTVQRGRLHLVQVSRRNLATWLIGGFAMSVVSGELAWDGIREPVLGWAELIK